jgi:hypothetical protein
MLAKRSITVLSVLALWLAASPAGAEGVFKSFRTAAKVGFKEGKQAYKDARAAGKPGLLKRGALAIGRGAAAVKNGAIEFGKDKTAQIKGFLTDLKENAAIVADDVRERAVARGVKIVQGTSRLAGRAAAPVMRVAGDVKERLDDVKENAKIVLQDAAERTGARIGRITGTIAGWKDHMVAPIKARLQARADRKFAKTDFKEFLNEEGNEVLQTYHVGAQKQARVGLLRFLRGAGLAGAGLDLAVALTNPIGLVGVGSGLIGATAANKGLKKAKLTAAERMVILAEERSPIPIERLQGWANGGVISQHLVDTVVEQRAQKEAAASAKTEPTHAQAAPVHADRVAELARDPNIGSRDLEAMKQKGEISEKTLHQVMDLRLANPAPRASAGNGGLRQAQPEVSLASDTPALAPRTIDAETRRHLSGVSNTQIKKRVRAGELDPEVGRIILAERRQKAELKAGSPGEAVGEPTAQAEPAAEPAAPQAQ